MELCIISTHFNKDCVPPDQAYTPIAPNVEKRHGLRNSSASPWILPLFRTGFQGNPSMNAHVAKILQELLFFVGLVALSLSDAGFSCESSEGHEGTGIDFLNLRYRERA